MKNAIVIEARQVIDAVESAARNKISTIIARKAELKDKKEEMESMLLEDKDYADVVTRTKLLAQVKKEAKTRALEMLGKEGIEKADEIKQLQSEIKESQLSLFDYLLDISQKTGKTSIVDNTGESHEIKITASIDI